MSPAQQVVLAVFGVLAGFAIGSFICVIVDRMPVALDEPNEFGDLFAMRPWGEVLGGGSRCSTCSTPVRRSDNIPVVSWLLLRGRCRTCGDRIPAFHPVIELLVPVVGLAVALGVGWQWKLLPVLWLVPVVVAISAIDIRTFMVPTRLVWPSFGIAVVLSAVAALAAGAPEWLLGGLVGILTLAGPLAVIWFVMPGGMGFGDVRLTTLLGWTVGFVAYDTRWVQSVFLSVMTLAMAAVLGITFSIIGLTARGRKAKVPFGPPLAIAALFCIAIAPEMLRFFEIT